MSAAPPWAISSFIDWKTGYLSIWAQRGFQEEFLACFQRLTVNDRSSCARALREHRHPIIVEDVMSDDGFAPYRDVVRRAGYRAVQSTPLVSSSGAVVGVLSTHFPKPHRPSDQTMERIQDIARATADAIIWHRARARREPIGLFGTIAIIARTNQAVEESCRQIARIDELTSLSADLLRRSRDMILLSESLLRRLGH